ncbi:MAG: stage II sporulation protein M [Planctomycetales bacterium]|nr:stage II sporulation protein M [Planctomycetales bacterium]MCA9171422.1 stage II sporulation protein M [Planctomycetales bacterium]
MKTAELLAARQSQWNELDSVCAQLENDRWRRLNGTQVSRFAALYRSACADLALADAYQLPPNTIQYLHRLVGRAHNQLYRSRTFDFAAWTRLLLTDVPRRIFTDGCVQVAFAAFWGVFLISAYLAASPTLWPDYAEHALGHEQIQAMEDSFSEPIAGRNAKYNPLMASFYIYHNTGIGLKCFAGGLLVLPGILITVFNAAVLGASFGYMARPDVPAGVNFFHFVTAHGPFELTAIVLSAGAGLRLGLSWLRTDGLTRTDSLRKSANETMPVMGAAMVLFFLAALIEGFLSPSAAPYVIKAIVAIISSGLLMFYFVVLGFPRETEL